MRNSRVPEPPRPADLIDILLARGGVQDAGGELRAMDLDKVQKEYFGRLARSNGMPLDTARELAVEAGYPHPIALQSEDRARDAGRESAEVRTGFESVDVSSAASIERRLGRGRLALQTLVRTDQT